MDGTCQFCLKPIKEPTSIHFKDRHAVFVRGIECATCGTYFVDDIFRSQFNRERYKEKIYLLQARTRHASEGGTPARLFGAVSTHMDSLKDIVPIEKLNVFLAWVVKSSEYFGSNIRWDPDKDYPLAYAKHKKEFTQLVYTLAQIGWITLHQESSLAATITGWEKAEEFSKKTPISNNCFIAMAFRDDILEIAKEAIVPAIFDTQYKPVYSNPDSTLDPLDDRIIADIRMSRFVIADVTYARPSVYYEAGFAYGLDKPVIWTCREDRKDDDMHFDTRQYPHIIWTEPKDLRERLKSKILAVIGPPQTG